MVDRITISNKIIELIEYVEKSYKNNKIFFSEYLITQETESKAKNIIKKILDENSEIIVKVNSSKEIDEIIYFLISIIIEQDLSSLLNSVYTNIESVIEIFSIFQEAVARIYEMKVEFDITK